MQSELIQVKSETTRDVCDAELAKCDKCGNVKFYVYTIIDPVWGKRLHFQCDYCALTFCSGHSCIVKKAY